MTTPDYPDWTQPVAAQEVSKVLDSGRMLTPVSNTSPLYDVSNFLTFRLFIGVGAMAAGTTGLVQLLWYDDAASSYVDCITVVDVTLDGYAINGITWEVPTRAKSVQVQWQGAAGSSIQIYAYANTRSPSNGGSLTTNKGIVTPILDTGTVSVPAGGQSAYQYTSPVKRAVAVAVNSTPSTIHVFGQVVTANPVTSNLSPLVQFAGNGTQQLQPELLVPPGAMAWCVQNGDTVAHSCRLVVWDVS